MASTLDRWGQSLRSSRIARASFSLMAGQVISGLVGFFFWAIVSRSFAPSEVGQATTIIAIAAAVTLLTTAGFGPALMLAIPRMSGRDTASAISTIAAVAAATGGFVLGVSSAWILSFTAGNLQFLTDGMTPWLLGAVSGAAAIGVVSDAVATATQRAHLVAVRAILFSVGKIGVLLFLLAQGYSPVTAVMVSWLATAALTGLVTLGWANRWTVPHHWRHSAHLLRSKFTHHHISALSGGFPPLLLPVLVTGVLGTAASAQFSIAWMVAAPFFMVSPAVASATLVQGAQNGTALRAQLRHASLLTAVLITPPILIATVFAAPLLGIFGDAYRAAAPLLILLALASIPDAVTNLAVAAERVRGRLNRATSINVLIGVTALIATWLLLPVLGVTAAGVAWLTAQTAGTVLVYLYRYSASKHAAR